MSPDELRNALLYGERTKELFERIPKDAMALSFTSLQKHNEDARYGRHFRRSLIVVAAIALSFQDYMPSDTLVGFFLVIVGYEFAYANAAKVRADLEDMQNRERLRVRVDEYLCEKFPGYVPPKEEFTLFHVSPYAK